MALAASLGGGTERERFSASLGFDLDAFQVAALDALDVGANVVVAAPTGSGKTVVAQYAVAKALAAGGKAFYTTPLKALSNQKYAELVAIHGAAKVGLLTGDNSINGNAPVVVMTTEVLRNMIYASSETLARLSHVVLDEVHYLQDAYRGPVWEEIIVHAPPEVVLVCLSATVSNSEELANWIATVRGETAAIVEERRPVELENLYLIGDRATGKALLLPVLVDGRPNPEPAALAAKALARPPGRGRPPRRLFSPRRVETVELLWDAGMLPAIYFIFSRAACDDAVGECLRLGVRLTSDEERDRLRALMETHVGTLADEDLTALGYAQWSAALEKGIAAHHAGLVPAFKEAVEEAFAAGLVKVVFATETLSVGINMPARAVVIERLTKFTGDRHQFLTPGEYTQLTGRAGRRGIDELGYAITKWSPDVPFSQVASLVGARTYALTSRFRPTYNMAVNLVARYRPEQARHLLNLSFAQYQTDSDVVRAEASLERTRSLLAAAEESARCELGDVAEYRRALEAARERPGGGGRSTEGGGAGVAARLATIHPGDVLFLPGGKSAGRVAVLSSSHRRGGDVRLRAITPDRRVIALGPADFDHPPVPVGRISLPEPYAPHDAAFQRRVASALTAAKVRGPAGTGKRRATLFPRGGTPAASHPVAACPDVRAHLRALERAERLEREVDRLERRVKGRTESLARQFDRVVELLEGWGYLDGWAVTEKGRRLARVYHECDLLVAECAERGLLDGLRPTELAGLLSVFGYEARGPTSGVEEEAWFPTALLERRAAAVARVALELNRLEGSLGLPLTRLPDARFAGSAYRWAAGQSLSEVLEDEDISGGDLVRNVRMLIDLARQIAAHAPTGATALAAQQAVDMLCHGVVAASSASLGSAAPPDTPSPDGDPDPSDGPLVAPPAASAAASAAASPDAPAEAAGGG